MPKHARQKSSNNGDASPERKSMTATELMRRKRKRDTSTTTTNSKEQEEDVDEQIRRLEAELQQDDSTSDDDSSDEDGNTDDGPKVGTERNSDAAILCFSKSSEARIDQLPETLLPSAEAFSTKRQRKNKSTLSQKNKPSIPSGLQKAVTELLNDYTPRSAERLPFYCRVCAKQYADLDTFTEHKTQAFHQAAVTMERKKSYCKLCRKQLTSPAQLKEHLQSKPHKERLSTLQSRQRGASNRPHQQQKNRGNNRQR